MWTAFDYLYRDAANFKAFGTVVLKGRLNGDDRELIRNCLSGGEFFIAEQVGVKPLYGELYKWSGGPTVSDHCWHEFSGFREVASEPEHFERAVGVTDFVARFRAVAEWDGAFSPHFNLAAGVASRYALLAREED
jgi:hypothetical protein